MSVLYVDICQMRKIKKNPSTNNKYQTFTTNCDAKSQWTIDVTCSLSVSRCVCHLFFSIWIIIIIKKLVFSVGLLLILIQGRQQTVMCLLSALFDIKGKHMYCTRSLKVDTWVSEYDVSKLRQDSHGFPIILYEMMISNSGQFSCSDSAAERKKRHDGESGGSDHFGHVREPLFEIFRPWSRRSAVGMRC